jgi:hypothetical protein
MENTLELATYLPIVKQLGIRRDSYIEVYNDYGNVEL